MLLAAHGHVPHKEFVHDPTLQDDEGNTVAMLLARTNTPIQSRWYHDTEMRNNKGRTVAMTMAANEHMIISQHWCHSPLLCDNMQMTIAMLYAYHGLVPPSQWEHTSSIVCRDGSTVAHFLAATSRIPPSQWEHLTSMQTFKLQLSVAMIMVQRDIDPPPQWYHDPTLCDNAGYTVAFKYAQNGVTNIPLQWRHSPTLRNKSSGYTVAMMMASRLMARKPPLIIPSEWYHSPYLENDCGLTVADLYWKSQVMVPEEWDWDTRRGYVWEGNVEENQCSVCFGDDKGMKMMSTQCGHVICKECCVKWGKSYCPYCKCREFRKRAYGFK